MNIKGIKTSKDWDFELHPQLAQSIDDYLAARERDDIFIGDYMDAIEADARFQNAEQDHLIYDYYLRGGYHADLID